MLHFNRRARKSLHYGKSNLQDIPVKIRPRPPDPDNPFRTTASIVMWGPIAGRRTWRVWQPAEGGARYRHEGTMEKTGKIFAILTHYPKAKWTSIFSVMEKSTCTVCDKFIGYFKDAHMCGECARYMGRCQRCNRTFDTRVDTPNIFYNGRRYCPHCISDTFDLCWCCGELGIATELQQSENEAGENVLVCRDCRNEHLCLCRRCGNYVVVCDPTALSSMSSALCYRCKLAIEREKPLKDLPITFRRIPEGYTYSVEIELSYCPIKQRLMKEYLVTTDGSVSGDGIEIRAGILEGDQGIAYLAALCKKLEEAECSADASCGGHIHIGGYKLAKEEDRRNIYACYALLQHHFFALVPKRRRRSNYAKLITTTYDNAVHDRYTWCNVGSYNKHTTIEIRIANGFNRKHRLIEWLTLHIRMFDWILSNKDAFEEARKLSNGTIEDFCKLLTALGAKGDYWLKLAKLYEED